MWVCECGFANNDASAACAACGAQAPSNGESAGSLVLVNLRTRQRIEIARPGGIIGRAGDFCPDSFTPRVSRVHLIAEAHENGSWTLEFVGRHKTEIDAAGVWTPLEPDMPREVVGGEKLRMADMLFRIEVVPGTPAAPSTSATHGSLETDASRAACHSAKEEMPNNAMDEYLSNSSEDEACGNDGYGPCCDDEAYSADDLETAEEPDAPEQIGWVVRCPVCGAAYPVDGPDARLDTCPACFDPLDSSKISRCAPQPLYE